MKVSLIVAVDNKNGIGKDNDLLWHLPKDMAHFKKTTLHHHIITGRKNYISIPERFRPLVDRTNIVLTRNKAFSEQGSIVLHSIEDALHFAKQENETEAFIIGGGQIYKEALEKDLVERLYVTHVDHTFEADTFFPAIDQSKWKRVSNEEHQKDEKNPYNFSFAVYEKMN